MKRNQPGDPPSERQQQVLTYIRQFSREHRHPPSFREIAAYFGWASTNAVADIIRRLEEKELVRRDKFSPRTLVAVESGE